MNFNWFTQKRTYLDFASSTPVDIEMHQRIPAIPEEIIAANPNALHTEGVRARLVIEQARTLVAQTLNAHNDEIIFTSGATESDNLAIVGVIQSWIAQGITPKHIAVITSALEHAAITETLAQFIDSGVCVVMLPTQEGIVDPRDIRIPQSAKAVLVSIMYVNNEIGTVQPIKEIAKRIRKLKKEQPDIALLFHTDATQAPLHCMLRVDHLGVDMMTLGATKLYTHKGVGVLYKKRIVQLVPLIRGGGQERGLRPGTEPIELIHTFAHALKYAQNKRDEETKRVAELQDYFESQVLASIPNSVITAQNQERTPHITHIGIPHIDSELLVIELDAKGIAVSAKSACKNDEDQESNIVESMYRKGWGGVRFSFGRTTSKKDIDRALKALALVVEKYTNH